MKITLYLITVALFINDWGSTGHRVIAEVASTYITKKTKEKINYLLDGETIVSVSTYADDIKSDSRFDEFYNWHFVNMDFDESYVDIVKSPKGDIIYAINKSIDVIQDVQSSKSEKAFYLKLLIHFIGDMHQPMHIGRYDDRGGNRISLKWFGRNTNLHRIWDSDMINSHNMSYSELAKNLPNPKQLNKVFVRDDLLKWLKEIHYHTKKIYKDISINDALGYEYQYQNFGLVKDQLLNGGIRLAAVLNYLFN